MSRQVVFEYARYANKIYDIILMDVIKHFDLKGIDGNYIKPVDNKTCIGLWYDCRFNTTCYYITEDVIRSIFTYKYKFEEATEEDRAKCTPGKLISDWDVIYSRKVAPKYDEIKTFVKTWYYQHNFVNLYAIRKFVNGLKYKRNIISENEIEAFGDEWFEKHNVEKIKY